MIKKWCNRRGEFEKRAAFALLASLVAHDKSANDAIFIASLPLIEQAASDRRNFVKKGASWALRAIGRRNPNLYAKAMTLAKRLASSEDESARWVGKDALRDLSTANLARRLATK